MRLAVIPARGGSKRIPHKNIRLFNGKPMIAWSIAAAQDSGCFDVVAVSTDDREIAAVAERYGAAVPFLRPTELADDHVGTFPVVRHAVEWYCRDAVAPSEVCCVYATAPFLDPVDIRYGLDVLEAQGSGFAFAVTSFPSPIQRALRLNDDSRVEMFHPEHFSARSQDLEPAYHDAGQFYWGRTSAWRNEKRVFGPQATAVILPRYRVQDIDTEEDWEMAEHLFRALELARGSRARE
jgi:N-acylneuraminate cytidylyltransferase